MKIVHVKIYCQTITNLMSNIAICNETLFISKAILCFLNAYWNYLIKKILPNSFTIFHNISTAKLVKFIWSSLLFFITSWIEIRFTLPLVPVPFQFNYWGQVNWHKLYHYFVFKMIECWFSLIIFACLL